ncbi:MAG: hypothetical protein QM740_21200 [Acidovorax sp.]
MSHRILQMLQRSRQRGLPMVEVRKRCAQLGMTNESVAEAIAALQQAGVISASEEQIDLVWDDAEIARLRHVVCLRCGRSDLVPDGGPAAASKGLLEAFNLEAAEGTARVVFGYCPACRLVVTWK